MIIEEAIKHCEEVAAGKTEQGKCPGCAADHKQLAEWLKELVTLRTQQVSPPNDPLTLDELREMDGEPVWLVTSADSPQWAFVADVGHEEFISFNCADWTEWEFDLYGDNDGVEWTAYRRKPEEG